MIEKIAELEQRLAEVNAALSDPSVTSDMKRMTALGKEYKELERVVAVGRKYRRMAEDIEGSKELIATETDEEMRELAKEELANLQPKLETLEAELKNLLIPKDPTDSKDVIMEIRAGTGGDEASLFAGDLFRMYQRYAEQKGWKFEVQEFHEGTVGGYKEVAISIKGEDVYGSLSLKAVYTVCSAYPIPKPRDGCTPVRPPCW